MSTYPSYVIAGLGATGLSCAHYLKEKGIKFAVTDSRGNPPQLEAFKKVYPDVQIALGELNADLLRHAQHIILSPGIPLSEPIIDEQVKRGAQVIGDIELFGQAVTAPVIAITGTNAKSTVTTLIGKMAEKAGYHVQVGGNLGVPALDLLRHKKANLFVLELSSFQLETTHTLKPKVATILNITPDHMDRYADLTAYQLAKQRVYQHCDIAVCNRDDSLTDTKQHKKIYFTLGEPKAEEFGLVNKEDKTYLARGTELLMPVSELPVKGKHYQENALAALAIGYAFGLPMEKMLVVLREFKGLPHRCQFVREIEGVSWINDSKGTNVGATEAAIKGLGSEINGKLILIAGGVGKNADFSSLAPLIEKYCRQVVLIGEAAQELSQVIGKQVVVTFAKDMNEAIHQAQDAAIQGDTVLLSPACASFDMFKNFEHRGDVFMELVEKL